MYHTVQGDLFSYIPDEQFRYHYSILYPRLRSAYDTVLEGLFEQRETIYPLLFEEKDIPRVYNAIVNDVPEMFFVSSIARGKDPPYRTRWKYIFGKDTCSMILRSMEERISGFTHSIRSLPDIQKAKAIHDFLIKNVTYSEKTPETPFIHTAYGPIEYSEAVCDGIAKAFKYIADRAGLRSAVVDDYVWDPGCQNEKNTNDINHAWNIVFADSCPYHVDVTFDSTLSDSGVIRYDYFLLSDRQINADHKIINCPVCPHDYEYYETVGMYAHSISEFRSIIRNELRPDRPIAVKVPDFDAPPDRVAKLLLSEAAECATSGQRIRVSKHRSGMVFTFRAE